MIVSPRTSGAARERLAHLAFARDSLLCREARGFPPAKQDLFLATYMAMRVIDDHVDGLKDTDRGPDGPAPPLVSRWREAIRRAATGRVSPGWGPLETDIFCLLARTLPDAGLGEHPWNALEQAMLFDAQGGILHTFSDFLSYAEGATVAPTYIFIWLLACDDSMKIQPPSADRERLWALARPLAVSCYLAHIMRDLVEDARSGEALLTIPRELHADLVADRSELAARLARGERLLVGHLRKRLFERFVAMSAESEAATVELSTFLDDGAQKVLARILGHYSACARMIGEAGFKD